jgi:protein arginine kinase activator
MSENEKRPPGCEHCKKNCVIHLTQIVNNEVKKVDMCETCPHAKQLQDPLQFGLMEKLLGIAMQQAPAGGKELVCDHCGYPESEFRKTGRLGCPECYDVFVTPKMEILRKIQDAEVHKGKEPKNQDKRALRISFARLNKELVESVESEDYERAAEIRDELKNVKEQLGKTDNNANNKTKKRKS